MKAILDRGELLSSETCGWQYVEGFTQSDDMNLAIVWDKVGLGHNGEDRNGGHSVFLLGGNEIVVPASEWSDFLKQQDELMARRAQDKAHQQSRQPMADRQDDLGGNSQSN